ncbi:MAG: carboxymuconolactone decarboxylase family protein [Bacteroidetes bacterium]|nr:carboxymuconolactone decarboxylase family protein [Bacteroidota bacterium]MBU1116964.1 carboxymuconolactone decarboxylase family protein [Bacteroidota bacterium]MBU1799137.1 carboxymuconolactone decarboxylase family protein [Bacteroidota bacterium]
MKKLSVITKEQASEQSKAIFENIEKSIGMLPNIYAVIGNSANSLGSYLAFSEAQKNGSFNAKEREAVFLIASEENGCSYCVSAHTAIAKMTGFSEEETIELRKGIYNNKKISALTNLTKSIIANRGKADENLVNDFYEVGYNEKAIVDLVALITEITFSNYIGKLASPEIDFPKAHNIDKAA